MPLVQSCREFAEETMGLFGGCEVNGSSVAACSRQMHTQLIQRQHVLKVVHQLKKVRASLSFFTQHVLSQFIIDATIFITCTITGPDFAAHSVIYCDAHE
jgi:hypothetical protein